MEDMSRVRRLASLLLATVAVTIALAANADTRQASSPAVRGHIETLGAGPNPITVVCVEGTPYEMGYAHGKLCADKAGPLYKSLTLAACFALKCTPEKLDEAYKQMEPFIPARYKEEMQGLADGVGVDVKLVQRAHAIPDLSEFHCTFFGAWGKATRDGHLHQIRALDYATEAGLQNYPALIVAKPKGRNAFVNIGWTGFIGCVSGMSGAHIAVSEIGDNFGPENETLAGEPMPFVLRDVLENANTLDEGVQIVRSARRTSSFLYCIGDGKIPAARALKTSMNFCEVYDPKTYPGRRLHDVVYWSMGTDSTRWNHRVYDALRAKWGQIDDNTGMQDVMKGLGTGSLHAVAYDATALRLWVANASPGPHVTKGCYREFVEFDLRKAGLGR